MHDQIGTLRTRGSARDALGLRLAAERALAGLSLAPAALPDAAILCLRRVQARADLQQALQGRAAREASVQAQANAAWSSAARPARGPVSAASAAVWFADEAELLACLAKDLLHGSAQTWWWAALLGPAVDAAALQRRWLAQAEAVPAALRQLSLQGLAAAVLGSWPTPFCVQLAERLAAVYGVLGWPPSATMPAVASSVGIQHQPGGQPAPEPAPGAAAWQARLQQCAGLHTLAPPQQQLWALATGLAQAPAQASQAGLAAGLQAALHRLETRPAAAHRWASTAIEEDADPAAGGPGAALAKGPGSALTGQRGASAHPSDPPDPTAREAGVRQRPEAPDPGAALQAAPGAAASPGLARAGQGVPADPLALAPRPATARATQQALPASLDASARGQLSARSPRAGLLYALRLALQLGLYGDFSQARRPGIALAPADWLALLGLRLFGPAFAQDPLWPLLAAWAGRASADPPGADFRPAHGQALQPWLGAQQRRCQRLARQCLPQQRQALRWLCQRPGRWALSSSRLDAHFDLATHPLAIRQAGLDRDLGWLPAAGLAVWLHFD